MWLGLGMESCYMKKRKKIISNRAGPDEREMKETISKPCKIQMVKEDNERRQEKHAVLWRWLDAGDPAAVPCLWKEEAVSLKHLQRKTFTAVIKC